MLLCCCITLNGLPTEIWPILINKWALFSKYMRSSSFYVFCPGWTMPSQTVTYLSNESLKVDIQFLQFCDCVDVEMEEKLSEQTYLKQGEGKKSFSISIKQLSIPSWVMIWPVIWSLEVAQLINNLWLNMILYFPVISSSEIVTNNHIA